MKIKENELYQEIELFNDSGIKVGEAEVDIKGKMLSRLTIFPRYRGLGYGTRSVKDLIEKYGIDVLWVKADNPAAIRVYEKCGFIKTEPTMYEMVREERQ